jgi:hypothetical protein
VKHIAKCDATSLDLAKSSNPADYGTGSPKHISTNNLVISTSIYSTPFGSSVREFASARVEIGGVEDLLEDTSAKCAAERPRGRATSNALNLKNDGSPQAPRALCEFDGARDRGARSNTRTTGSDLHAVLYDLMRPAPPFQFKDLKRDVYNAGKNTDLVYVGMHWESPRMHPSILRNKKGRRRMVTINKTNHTETFLLSTI